jgi:hypothetical protein
VELRFCSAYHPVRPGESGDPASWSKNAAHLQAAVKETLHQPQLIAEGERMERIIEYVDPASTHKNVAAVVSGISPEQKARVLKLLAGEK